MKTITDIIKIIGQEQHNNITELSNHVLIKCNEFNVSTTKAKKPISDIVISRIIRDILSKIKTGHKNWNTWSYKIGNNSLQLYHNDNVEVFMVKFKHLINSDYDNVPLIKVLVRPQKEGINSIEFYQEFTSISKAKQYMKNEEFAIEMFISIGKYLIPLNNFEI